MASHRQPSDHDETVSFAMPASMVADLDWLGEQRGETREQLLCEAVELLLEYRRLADEQALATRAKYSRRRLIGAD